MTKRMKKKISFATLLLAGTFALISCEKDIDSNPVLIQGDTPVVFPLNVPEFATSPVALSGTEDLTISWTQPKLTADNAPLGQESNMGLSYTVQVSKDGNFTKTFTQALDEVTDADGNYTGVPSGYDYVQLATTYSACKGKLDTDELNLALNQLFLYDKDAELPISEVFVRVLGMMTLGDNSIKQLATSNVVSMKLIASEWIDVLAVPAKESYLWVPGNGNGWNHGVAPVLVSSDGVVYSGYAYMNGEFKFTPVDKWEGEYNNGSFTTVSDNIDLGDGGGGNINCTGPAGMYYLTVDVVEKSLKATPVTWSIIGGFNSWGGDEVMTYDESNHCLTATVNFAEDTEWKFRRDADWAVNLGGSLNALEQDGGNLSATAGEHTIQLFLERPAQDGGFHATIK
jgi:hypothetical protein